MKNQKQTKTAPQKLQIPLTERLKSIPEFFGLRLNEEPSYRVVLKEGEFEVREYAPQVLAHVTLEGKTFDQFREEAFRHLAAYFFGGNLSSTQIAMTAPVLEKQEAADRWTMSFVLPSKFKLENAPKPLDSAVRLEESPSYRVAVIQYSGNNHERKIEAEEQKLNDWLLHHPQLQRSGNTYTAQYDAPFVLPFMKKNEIHLKVMEVH